MADPKKPQPIPKDQAPGYVRKGREFAAAAKHQLDAEKFDAALLCAVHAAISACDSVCVALGGVRSTDSEHNAAIHLLESMAPNSAEFRHKAGQLRSLLALKNRIAYESKAAKRKEAQDGVARCERLVEWAVEVPIKAKFAVQ